MFDIQLRRTLGVLYPPAETPHDYPVVRVEATALGVSAPALCLGGCDQIAAAIERQLNLGARWMPIYKERDGSLASQLRVQHRKLLLDTLLSPVGEACNASCCMAG